MGIYTKIRDKVDSKIQKISENPEQLLEKVKLADVVVVVGGFMLLGFALSMISSITNFILLWATKIKNENTIYPNYK